MLLLSHLLSFLPSFTYPAPSSFGGQRISAAAAAASALVVISVQVPLEIAHYSIAVVVVVRLCPCLWAVSSQNFAFSGAGWIPIGPELASRVGHRHTHTHIYATRLVSQMYAAKFHLSLSLSL